MDLWQPDRLILFLAAFLPGFVSLKVWDLLVAGDSPEFNRFWLDAIGYGAFNFAAFSWLIVPVWTDGRAPEIWMWPVVFLLGPVFWPILVWWVRTRRWLIRFLVHPIRRPWDYVFSQPEARWVLVHLKDGMTVGGRFDTKSFASSAPAEEQIYIEELWHLDENRVFVAPIKQSSGAIILGSEIRAVEFLSGEA